MKFYAVKNGRIPGIYTNWDACKAQVIKYPGAEYKSFSTEKEANAYLAGIHSSEFTNELVKPYAFVDGSFNAETNVYGFGGFLIDDKGNEHILQGHGDTIDMASMRNVAGEILGAITAVKKAIELKLSKITIYYDYKGIECWVNGSWECKNPCTKMYREYMSKFNTKIDIKFIKVPAHTGITGNERADRLAKEAVGL